MNPLRWAFWAVAVPLALTAPGRGASNDGTVTLPATWASDQDVSGALVQADALVHAPEALAKYPALNGSGYTVAVIDTGIAYDHPALAGRYLGGYDFVNQDADPLDDNGHGTHVSGIIASTDAAYRGIAGGAGIVSLKVLDAAGRGSWADINSALQWVIDHRTQYNIVAVNLSLTDGGSYNSPTVGSLSTKMLQLKDAGVFLACASGNDWYAHQQTPGTQGVSLPAADPSAVAVGAVFSGDFGQKSWKTGAIDFTSGADRVTSFTDRSTTLLDLLAPGAIVASANKDWAGANPDFIGMSGTSMASPFVAAAAVLVHQAIDTYWSPAQRPVGAAWEDTILNILQTTGAPVYDGDDENDNVRNLDAYFSRVDVLAALDYTVPEPTCLAMMLAGLVLLRVRPEGRRQ